MAQDTDPEIQRRLEAAADTDAAARILVDECGYDLEEASFAAGIMRGETAGDVIDPDEHVPANP